MKSFPRLAMMAGGCAALLLALAFPGRKDSMQDAPQDHFGTAMNYPRFHSFQEFLHDFRVVFGISRGRFQGQQLDLSWISPGFREKVCLTVTLADHCVA